MGEIRTGRLFLREYREEDAARISDIANSKKIANNMGDDFPYPCTSEAVKKWVDFFVGPENSDKNFVIIFEGEVIGGTGFKLKTGFRKGTASGGYWLGEAYWGKGIATEAWGAMVDYIFENYDVRRIDVGTFSWNSASHKVLEKCGFSKESCVKNSLIRFGNITDEIRYGLLRGEWEVLNHKI